MDVLATILEWSADKPDWQRDALRRLVTDGPLSEANFDELTLLCESRHGLHEDVPFEPLERSHLSLAAFFAELSTADDPSAILFDDPVSSLDHKWRRALAQRLVEPHGARQLQRFKGLII